MPTTDFLLPNGQPNLPELINCFTRCAPTAPGGIAWLDDIADCHWANQSPDGRKHDVQGNPNGAALPWDGASDCRPMVVDDAVGDLVALLTSSFWRSMAQHGGANTEASAYAVALTEHLIFNQMLDELVDEVELSAQYTCRYGWCLLAPRWVDEIGMKRKALKIEEIQSDPALLALVLDPTQEDAAAQVLVQWYDTYVSTALPERIRSRAPKTSIKLARKVVRELRETGASSAPIPYLCRSEPEISALKPWEDVFVPPELSAKKLQTVFSVEYVSEADLRGRILSEGYNEKWAEAACLFKGQTVTATLPVGESGNALRNLGGASRVNYPGGQLGNTEHGLITIVHAIYREADEDNVPCVYCTTFHPAIGKLENGTPAVGRHELVQSHEGALPYVDSRFESRSRALTSSRGVPELTFTDQSLIKGLNDQMLDRASLTTLPPVNVYTSPTGVPYRFAPAAQNYVTPGREPQFMSPPSSSGVVDNLKAEERIMGRVNNRFGRPTAEAAPGSAQTKQEKFVRRFLLAWTRALKQALCLYQANGSDAEFAEITGAEPGWLDAHRDAPGVLGCALKFDVRELDPELFIEQVKAVNQVVLPQDVLGTVNRGKWTRVMMRGINPEWAREVVMPQADASQALRDKAQNEVLKMFAGNQPNFLDKQDPTAEGLLKYTLEIVQQNPNYLRALTDEALIAVVGAQQAMQLVQMLGQRTPDPRWSGLLLKWIENLKFIGVTQPRNRQIGRIGVDPEQEQG